MVRLWDGFDCGKRKFKMSRGRRQREPVKKCNRFTNDKQNSARAANVHHSFDSFPCSRHFRYRSLNLRPRSNVKTLQY